MLRSIVAPEVRFRVFIAIYSLCKKFFPKVTIQIIRVLFPTVFQVLTFKPYNMIHVIITLELTAVLFLDLINQITKSTNN
jgi:hypothetical protein